MGRFNGIGNCINEYFKNSTAHGLRRSGWAVTIWGKLFWLIVFGVGVAAFVLLLGFLIADFTKYPVKIAKTSQTHDTIEFPAVTVCNLGGGSQSLNDTIVYCSYDGGICYPENRFTPFQSVKYGSTCYTFNSKDVVNKMIAVNTGRNYGLTLMLNVNRNINTPTQPNEEGFRIVIHPPGSQPYPEIDGFSLPTGFEAAISVSYHYYERLGKPYTDCTDQKLDSAGYNATSLTCQAPCIFKTQECDCKPLCRETTIEKQYVLSQWPSQNHQETIMRMLRTSRTWGGNLPNGGIDITQLGTFSVYFKDFTSKKTSEKKAFTLPQLISEIGGLSALFIGFSVLTVFEFVEFLLSLVVAPMSSSDSSSSKAETDRESLSSGSDPYDRTDSRLSKETVGVPPHMPRMSSTPSFAIQDFHSH